MIRQISSSIFLIALTVCAQSALALPMTFLEIHSDEGELIGMGNSYFYEPPTDLVNAAAGDNSGDGLFDSVWFAFSERGFGNSWSVNFSSRQLGLELVAGFYDDAMRYPFADPGHPGLSVSGNRLAANRSTGNFTIIEAVYDYSVPHGIGTIVSFAAEFEHHIEGHEPALRGRLYYNYEPAQVSLAASPSLVVLGMVVMLITRARKASSVNCGT